MYRLHQSCYQQSYHSDNGNPVIHDPPVSDIHYYRNKDPENDQSSPYVRILKGIEIIDNIKEIQCGIDDQLSDQKSYQYGIWLAVTMLLNLVKIQCTESGNRFYEQIWEYIGVKRRPEDQLSNLVLSDLPHSDLYGQYSKIQDWSVDTVLPAKNKIYKDRSQSRKYHQNSHGNQRDIRFNVREPDIVTVCICYGVYGTLVITARCYKHLDLTARILIPKIKQDGRTHRHSLRKEIALAIICA